MVMPDSSATKIQILVRISCQTIDKNRYITIYSSNSSLHKTMTASRSNTITTEDGGRTNLWATEPRMYIDRTAAERYGYETYAERAEKLNGRTAMLGFIAALISYATSDSIFFFGAFGI